MKKTTLKKEITSILKTKKRSDIKAIYYKILESRGINPKNVTLHEFLTDSKNTFPSYRGVYNTISSIKNS